MKSNEDSLLSQSSRANLMQRSVGDLKALKTHGNRDARDVTRLEIQGWRQELEVAIHHRTIHERTKQVEILLRKERCTHRYQRWHLGVCSAQRIRRTRMFPK